MISAQSAIHRIRRDLTVSTVLKYALVVIAVVGMVIPNIIGFPGGDFLMLMLVGAAWLALSYRSIQGSRVAADSQQLIAAGRLELAEKQIEQSLASFSIFRHAKLMTIHHLAMLRHAQKRWGDTALLCRALLGERLGSLGGISRASRLILADALVEMGDLAGAYQALSELYRQRLSLGEALSLLGVQTEYEVRIGAWSQLMQGIETKVRLAELMPAEASARVQAMLALASKKTGRNDWQHWLRRRVELLCDVQALCKQRSVLWELWQVESTPSSPVSSQGGAGDAGSM